MLETMCTMAGAAMNTLSVLERERGTAIELQKLDELHREVGVIRTLVDTTGNGRH